MQKGLKLCSNTHCTDTQRENNDLLFLAHTHTNTHIHTHTHTLSLSHTHSHTHTNTHSLFLSLTILVGNAPSFPLMQGYFERKGDKFFHSINELSSFYSLICIRKKYPLSLPPSLSYALLLLVFISHLLSLSFTHSITLSLTLSYSLSL